MTNYNLRLHKGNHPLPQPEPRRSTDKIAGSFSNPSIAYAIIKYLITTDANLVAVNEKQATTTQTVGEPAFEMASSLVTSSVKVLQNNWLYSFIQPQKNIHF